MYQGSARIVALGNLLVLVLVLAAPSAQADVGMTSGGGSTYSLSVGGVYAADNVGAENSFGGLGVVIDGDLGFMVGDLGGLVLFGRFNTFSDGGTPPTTVDDVQLGLRAFLIPVARMRVSLGAGLLIHSPHNIASDVRATDFGAVAQAGIAYEFARKGEFGFEVGADVSIAAHNLPDSDDSSTLAGVAIWIGVRHRHPD